MKICDAQVLINQLKDVTPVIQNSIMELTEEVNSISSNPPPPTQHHGRSTSSIQSQSSGRAMVISVTDIFPWRMFLNIAQRFIFASIELNDPFGNRKVVVMKLLM